MRPSEKGEWEVQFRGGFSQDEAVDRDRLVENRVIHLLKAVKPTLRLVTVDVVDDAGIAVPVASTADIFQNGLVVFDVGALEANVTQRRN